TPAPAADDDPAARLGGRRHRAPLGVRGGGPPRPAHRRGPYAVRRADLGVAPAVPAPPAPAAALRRPPPGGPPLRPALRRLPGQPRGRLPRRSRGRLPRRPPAHRRLTPPRRSVLTPRAAPAPAGPARAGGRGSSRPPAPGP